MTYCPEGFRPLALYSWLTVINTIKSIMMNKLFSIALLPVVALLLAIQSETGNISEMTSPKGADPATVYFYRGKQFGSALQNFVLKADGKEICRLSVKRYVVYKGQPGKVAFSAVEGGLAIPKKEMLELELEAGKSYYVQCDVKSGLVTTRMEMTEVTESTAKKKMEGMEADNCMSKGQ